MTHKSISQEIHEISFLPFIELGDTLKNPFAGGLNQPQFSYVNLNEDSHKDLYIFDRAGNTSLVFLNVGTPGESEFIFDRTLSATFPPLSNWALLRDYNLDGKADIFTAQPNSNLIRVFRQEHDGLLPTFTLSQDTLFSDEGSIFVPSTDLPSILDLDGDGDLDIMTFDAGGFFLKWFRNMRQENGDEPNALQFILADECWGEFREDGLTNDVYLGQSCGTNGIDPREVLHAGSTVGVFDVDADGAKDLVIGDISFSNLSYLHNGGSDTLAQIDKVNARFPPSQAALLDIFPAPYFLDGDNDGKTDMIVAPNAPGVSADFQQIWFYRNTGSEGENNFEYVQNDFLQHTMIDCGEAAKPVFFDYNSDGLLDLVIGNDQYKRSNLQQYAGLTLYENVGTATSPVFELVDRDYLQLEQTVSPPIQAPYPTFGDLDNDGDEDLIIGGLNGKLHFFRNVANLGEHADFRLEGFQFFGIDVGLFASPQLVDLNEDGSLDLLIGEYSGTLNFLENLGDKWNPRYDPATINDSLGAVDVLPTCCTGFSVPFAFKNGGGEWEMLVGSEDGNVYQFTDISGNFSSNFTLVDSFFLGRPAGTRTTLFGRDIDRDGFMEFVSGNERGGINMFSSSLLSTSTAEYGSEIPPFSLFPNPAGRGECSISLQQRGRIRLISLEGKILWEGDFLEGTHPLSFPLTLGTYFVQFIPRNAGPPLSEILLIID